MRILILPLFPRPTARYGYQRPALLLLRHESVSTLDAKMHSPFVSAIEASSIHEPPRSERYSLGNGEKRSGMSAFWR